MIDNPLVKFLWHYRKINISICAILFVIYLLLVLFVIPLEYTARVSVIPSQMNFAQSIAGQITEVSKMMGLKKAGLSTQSQEMFKGIIFSRRVLASAMYKEYKIAVKGDTVKNNIIDFLEIEGENKREIDEKTIKKLRDDIIYVDIDKENDILYLEVTTEYPELSAALANHLAVLLNDVVKNEVQKEYRQQYDYLVNRIKEIEDSLRIHENELQIFLEKNPDASLPKYQVEKLRHIRNLEVQTAIYTEFRKQLEIFIAENIMNLSDIKILDHAVPPFKKSRPKRSLLLISMGILSLFIQVTINGSILIYRRFKRNLAEMSVDAL